ncbi:putative membrane protein [Rhodoligotrophos appendicifer]|uniref:DUF2243 domain-containing protein n=1 Tax=Rhodoligotrophos appendicifer TaxID=987056 RepID=UPI001186A239|nr:DUF2243 domain-containing protein [Rhodoligotrophos appendicifer]
MWQSPWTGWGMVLGFALGGFFDGILLHQILQWHHLLSLVPGLTDLRMQVLWDGYFHALMYLIAAIGLWGLWKAHSRAGDAWDRRAWGRQLGGALLIGFGLWHVVDGILSHWVLGIHRIKLDSPNPLVWDLIWLFVFGVAPALLGWLLVRGGGRPGRISGATLALLLLTGTTLGLGVWSLRPPPDQPFTTVVFRPGMDPQQVFETLALLDARLVWSDPTLGVVVVDMPPARKWAFYSRGALLVSGSGVPAGCFDWARI